MSLYSTVSVFVRRTSNISRFFAPAHCLRIYCNGHLRKSLNEKHSLRIQENPLNLERKVEVLWLGVCDLVGRVALRPRESGTGAGASAADQDRDLEDPRIRGFNTPEV